MQTGYLIRCYWKTDANGRNMVLLHRPDALQAWRRVFDPELENFDDECDAAAAAAVADIDPSHRIIGKAHESDTSRTYFVICFEAPTREESAS